jgi:hypothetical protein
MRRFTLAARTAAAVVLMAVVAGCDSNKYPKSLAGTWVLGSQAVLVLGSQGGVNFQDTGAPPELATVFASAAGWEAVGDHGLKVTYRHADGSRYKYYCTYSFANSGMVLHLKIPSDAPNKPSTVLVLSRR